MRTRPWLYRVRSLPVMRGAGGVSMLRAHLLIRALTDTRAADTTAAHVVASSKTAMLKKIVKILAVVIVAALVVIQFFRIDKTNPTIVEGNTIDAAMAVPPDVKLILGRSCNDCHSNNTVYPWYSNVQPVAWFLKDHIDEGRHELNLSEFNTYSAKKKKRKLEEVCEMVESAAMPLPSYLWIHRDAGLSETEKRALCDWAKAGAAKIVVE